MLKTGRSIRGLGKKDLYRVLRWGPMAVADLVANFSTPSLSAPRLLHAASSGRFWDRGRQAARWFCCCAQRRILPRSDLRQAAFNSLSEGGAITAAMAAAAKEAGAEIRTDAAVSEICVKDGVATGVVLASGGEITAKTIVSNADPKRTLMHLVDPIHLSPDFVQKIKNYRAMGTVAKVNLALSALPDFTALKSKAMAKC